MKTIGFRACVLFLFLGGFCASLSAQPAPRDNPVQLYRQGIEARTRGDYYAAIEYFRQALAKNPAYFDALLSCAEMYFLLEEYDEALSLTDKAIGLSAGSAAAGVLRGRILVGMGDTPGAEASFKRVLAAEPNNVDARLAKAELDIARGKNRNAALEYLETLNAAPNNRRALLSLALLYQNMGDLPAARKYFELAVRYHGEAPITHLLAGEFFLRENRLEDAENHASIALSIRPDYEDAFMLLGAVHLVKGRFDSVYSLMDTVLKLNRQNASAWYLKGLAALRMGKPKESIDLLRALVSLKPEDEIARVTLEDTLREFLPMEDPVRKSYGDFHFDRGDRFQERNLFSRAHEEYRRGLQIDPYSKRGRMAFADILAKLGFPARSLSALNFLKEQKLSDKEIDERIEIAESLLDDRVSRTWGVDEAMYTGRRFVLSVFVDSSAGFLQHHDSGIYLARFFGDLLVGTPRFTLSTEPRNAANYGAAFQESRQRGSDYFIILAFAETDREFSISADLYLSRTGGKIDSLRIYRTGNDRIQNGLVRLAADLVEKFPPRGSLVKREFERGLVNLGVLDGIKEGDALLILAEKAVALKHDGLAFVYKPEDILGTLNIMKTDDSVSEGVIEKRGFFDRINPGDTVIPGKLPEKDQKPDAAVTPDIPLYKRILRIR